MYITKATSIALFATPAVDKGDLHALPSNTEALRRPPQLKGDLHALDNSKGDLHAPDDTKGDHTPTPPTLRPTCSR